MKRRHAPRLAIAALILLGCESRSSPPTSTPAADSQDPAVKGNGPSQCALLDNPAIRQQMSAAFELKLLRLCSREMPRLNLNFTPVAASRTPVLRLQSSLDQLGTTDIPISNPSADTGGHTTQSETSMVAVGNTVCAAWNDAGEGYGANGFSGFGYSLDGGHTFTDGGPFPLGLNDNNEGDPSLAYSVKDGAYYYAALSTKGLSLWKSTNNCQTFQYVGAIHVGSGDDKELMAIDNTPTSPYYGRIYVGWTDFAASSDLNVVAYSTNSGATWSAAVTMAASGSNGQGMWPAVAPNGDVYFALLNRSGSVGGLQSQWIYKSTNGGSTWTKMTNIATNQLRPENPTSTSSCGRQALNGNIRNLPSPQISISPDSSAAAGYIIHSIYSYDSDGSGPDQSNVFYRRSLDGATTWSAEVKLNDDTTNTDQFFAAIGVSETGILVASWYDRRLDPTSNLAFDRYVSYSTDKGQTWSVNQRVSDVSSGVAQTNPNFDGLATCYHGDYDQLAVTGSVAHLVWSDDRRVTSTGPNPDVYYDQFVVGKSISIAPSIFEGGDSATGTVMLIAPAPVGGTTVTLVSSAPGLVTVPAQVVVHASSTTATFPVTSVQTQSQTSVTITGTFPDATTASYVVTVLASPTPTSITLSPTSVQGGQSSTATVTLSRPAPAGGSVLTLSATPTTVATVPATLTVAEGAQTATFAVNTLSQSQDTSANISASLHGVTKTTTLIVSASPGNAVYDATLKVPRCMTPSSNCDTGPTLIRGRGSLAGGVEIHSPNTVNGTCLDGNAGTFHGDESLDRLRIVTVDGSTLAAGKQATVEATVWVYSSSDYLDVFFAPDANTPVWTLVATLPVTGSQVLKVLTTTFTLPQATLPAIRGQWRYGGSAVSCMGGSYDDKDDLIFVYGTAPDTEPPTVTINSPTNNALLRAVIPVIGNATDNVGVTGIVLAVDNAKLVMTKGTAPYNLPFNTQLYADGPHQLTAVASDAAGNTGTSAPVAIVIDNTVPTVSLTSPAPGAQVTGTVSLTAAAADVLSGVASVEFLVDGIVIGTDGTAPYSVDWDTSAASPGSHTLTAKATDVAGNQTVSTSVLVTVVPINTAPVVSAGSDSTVTLPNPAALLGTVTDDGLPAPPALTIAWSKVSGPGTVTFDSASSANTTATFSVSGTYVLRLTASDGVLSASDDVQVTANQAPIVNAGPDISVTLPAEGTLDGTATDDGFPLPPTLTVSWSKTSGPGTVTFANASAASTTASFSTFGVYVLRLTASDGAVAAFDEVTVTVDAVNQAPVVNAGPDGASGLSSPFTLNGTATDDGLPVPATLTVAWSKTSGPGTVTFANEQSAATSANFSALGVYVLRLTANDGALSAFDEVQVTVGVDNQAPVVGAGSDQAINLPATATLTGTVTDDGLPEPPTLSINWSKTSGPGIVTFAPQNAAETVASFSTNGVYVLRVTASDGALSSFDEVQVTVGPANQAPVVQAGPDQAIVLPATAALDGTVTDDGLPTPGSLTTTWSKTSGAGNVTFANPSAKATTATFSAPGSYTLRLTATDGALSAFDEVQVLVAPEVLNQPPVVGAGADKSINLPSTATLNGSVTDDGLPAPPTLTINWTKTSGPGTVTFTPPSAATTIASFSAPGVYVLRLTANDGALSAFDEVQVTVGPANQAPVVNAGLDKSINLPNTATLNGTVTDDGLPTPPVLTIGWTKASGPGTVTFTPPSAATTVAAFSVQGVYVLRLTASDGALSSFDEVVVTVGPANQVPVVNAGPDVNTMVGTPAALSGIVTDDGLPTPPTLTIGWTKVSGPGNVTFSAPGAAVTNATFSAAGTYVVRLTASDSALSAIDEAQVTVLAATPCALLCSNPTTFTINGSYQSGSLGTGAVCRETTSVVHGGNCGNFASPRTLSVNGVTRPCTGSNWSSVPPPRNGGYCIQTTAGNHPWAYFSAW